MEVYPRHRAGCPNAKPTKKSPEPRKSFDGCPLYARYTCRDLHTGEILEDFHGSLKGITSEIAAREYIENRYIQLRNRTLQPNQKQRNVRDAVKAYIDDKRRELGPMPPAELSAHQIRTALRLGKDPYHREHESVNKLIRLLEKRFCVFCEGKKIRWIVDLQYEHLTAFLDIRQGRTVSIVEKGVVVGRKSLPPLISTKRQDQSLMKGFFRWLQDAGWIPYNPAERLRPIRQTVKAKTEPIEQEARIWTATMIQRVRGTIPEVFAREKKQKKMRCFFNLLVYTSARITDVAGMETRKLDENGIMFWEYKKSRWIYAILPPFVVADLRELEPCCDEYFFWNGKGIKPESTSQYLSVELLKVYRAAGIPEGWQGGPRNHEFRDTVATGLVDMTGRYEDAQLALAHDKRETTEEHYIQETKVRFDKVNQRKREMWEAEGLWE